MENKKERFRKHGIDMPYLLLSLAIVAIGFLTMVSAYSGKSMDNYTTGVLSFVVKQTIIMLSGAIFALVAFNMKWEALKGEFTWIVYGGALLAILLTMVIGAEGGYGTKRWLDLGFMTVQPSEFMKIALIMVMAKFTAAYSEEKRKSFKGFCHVVAFLVVPVLAVAVLQRHMSAAILFVAIYGIMILISGIKLRYVLIGGTGTVLAGICFLLFSDGFRLQRIFSWLNVFDPDKMRDGSWQIVQSLYAIASGGLFGRGYTQSREKFSWLPMADNDYIFAVFAEECGFILCTLMVILFAAFIWRGFIIALKAPNKYLTMLAFGVTVMFALQIVLNLCIVCNVLPSTGIQLPFFSSGGSSMITSLIGVGLVLNVSQYTQ